MDINPKETEIKKLAVVFPGVGYHKDKPVLYYSRKLAMEEGYEIKEIAYTGLPKNIRGNKELMKQAFYEALEQSRELLKDIKWEEYEEILFIMKSVGTVVGAVYAKEEGINPRMLIYTPVKETFDALGPDCRGIVFSGTSDSWADTEDIKAGCGMHNLPLHLLKDANHSLELGYALADIQYLHEVMRLSREFIRAK